MLTKTFLSDRWVRLKGHLAEYLLTLSERLGCTFRAAAEERADYWFRQYEERGVALGTAAGLISKAQQEAAYWRAAVRQDVAPQVFYAAREPRFVLHRQDRYGGTLRHEVVRLEHTFGVMVDNREIAGIQCPDGFLQEQARAIARHFEQGIFEKLKAHVAAH